MKRVVVYYLGLRSTDVCHIVETKDWLCGSFNIYVPVIIDNWKCRQQPGHHVLLQFPLPYRVSEGFQHGNGDKKIQCEAGAYAWLKQNCVPIPLFNGNVNSIVIFLFSLVNNNRPLLSLLADVLDRQNYEDGTFLVLKSLARSESISTVGSVS